MADCPDPTAATVALLKQQPAVLAKLGSSGSQPWIFTDGPGKLIESTGKAACVVRQQGGWTSPNLHNTAKFPRIMIEVYVDPDRDANGNATKPARARAQEILDIIDPHLHRPYGGEWPVACAGFRVLASHRMDEPDFLPVPDGDGMVMGRASYGLTCG